MKVGIISDRLNRTLAGVGRYIYNLIRELSKISKDDLFLINYIENNTFNLNKIIINNPFNFLPKKYAYYSWHIYLNYYLKSKKLDLDIIHSPENITLFIKLRENQKKVITVHDIMPYIFNQYHHLLLRCSYKFFLLKTLRTADKIISVSYNTKKDIIKYFKIPEDKIKVIYHGIDRNYKPLPEEEIESIKKKYNINYPFILYTGGLAPNKNVERLIYAFYKLKKKLPEYKLIITGIKRYKYKSIFETIDKLNLQKDIIFTGYVPEEDLPALYNAADLFVYPSIYEGFGLPPLEAMACGTPVITSNTSSLPEVVGDAGIMVDPYDVDGLSKAMYEVLTNDGLREELRKKGLERAKLFSWKECAEEHLKVYEEVYNMK
ncbi:glycosyl transferase family 1 [Methanofervidicoccus sp. A16]|uniref:glycosyltransferase family 4 protein n=1 Tax=Methanofervidicoccus sp. A16 TaxID=2607662 RepID=UPI00118ADF2D|nr:glycosyltransferase family 1 protein [Methanofervidicoccus sp. A16]AXI24803.1 glycosyl transferase family 1 [Methanofervidicoccus sp. A16]